MKFISCLKVQRGVCFKNLNCKEKLYNNGLWEFLFDFFMGNLLYKEKSVTKKKQYVFLLQGLSFSGKCRKKKDHTVRL